VAVRLNIFVSPEAMDLFAPLRPCPECGRPLPEPFDGSYRHWEGCSVGEKERVGVQSDKVGE